MTDLAYGPLHPDIMVSPRLAPPMIGLGLLETIPDSTLMAASDPQDEDDDGISGRFNQVWDITKSEMAIGRFGWKAGMPTLDQQNQNAFQFDIGLSTRFIQMPAVTARLRKRIALQHPMAMMMNSKGWKSIR